MSKGGKKFLVVVFIMFCSLFEVVAQLSIIDSIKQQHLVDEFYPISILKFEAQRISDSSINLFWSTSITSYRNDLFYIERSEDGVHWIELGQYQGDGNGKTIFDYSFIDDKAIAGKNVLYRLKQYDVNGIFEYSQMVDMPYMLSEKLDAQTKVSSHTIYLAVPEMDEIKKMELLDIKGTMLYKEKPKKNSLELKYSNLSKEIYFIKLYLSNQVVVSKLVFN